MSKTRDFAVDEFLGVGAFLGLFQSFFKGLSSPQGSDCDFVSFFLYRQAMVAMRGYPHQSWLDSTYKCGCCK